MVKKILVAFYSRDGHCREVARRISKKFKADVDEIIDKTSRAGIVGWLVGGKDAFKRNITEIETKKDSSKYDLVVIGTPVWAGTMTPAVRTYLQDNKKKIKKIAFFCCFGSSESKTFKEMQEIIGEPVAVLGLKDKEENREAKIKDFCENIRKIK